MNRQDVIETLSRHKAELRQQFGLATVALFGSLARGEGTPASDIDLLVEFDKPITLFDLVALEQRLETLLGVRKVDVVLRDSIFPELRGRILSEAVDVR